METTFYEDSRGGYRGVREEMRGTKRPMTLDLNSGSKSKKPRPTALLTSPDLNMLKLESPELEKLIMQQHAMSAQGGHCMYPKPGDHHHPYPRDFPDALQQQQQPNFSNLYQQPDIGMMQTSVVDSYGYPACNVGNPMVSSSTNCSYPSSMGYYQPLDPSVTVKEEPQTVPCASPPDPPTSPIDMEDQEKLKLERKRLRNRIAASKCRRRKLERIARLEDKVAHLKSENAELQGHVTRLKEHVCHLKQQVLDHVRSGCDILVSSNTQQHSSYSNGEL